MKIKNAFKEKYAPYKCQEMNFSGTKYSPIIFWGQFWPVRDKNCVPEKSFSWHLYGAGFCPIFLPKYFFIS
jgi:hypothetical protein